MARRADGFHFQEVPGGSPPVCHGIQGIIQRGSDPSTQIKDLKQTQLLLNEVFHKDCQDIGGPTRSPEYFLGLVSLQCQLEESNHERLELR